MSGTWEVGLDEPEFPRMREVPITVRDYTPLPYRPPTSVAEERGEVWQPVARNPKHRILGMTGSRDGASEAQRNFMRRNVEWATEVHHGCRVGADWEFHLAAVPDPDIAIILHPPTDTKLMMPLRSLLSRGGIHVLKARPYMARNRKIVDASQRMIATPTAPDARGEVGGTWNTIRYAWAQNVPIDIMFPDGSMYDDHDENHANGYWGRPYDRDAEGKPL